MKLPDYWMLVLVLIGAGVTGCKPHEGTKSAGPALPCVPVRVQSVETKKHLATEETLGTVRPKLQARLEAKVAGRILEMRAAPGQSFKAGELLVRLDAQEIGARLEQALAGEQQAANDLKRFTALLASGAATPAEFDAAQARARVAQAAVKEAQTMLGYAEVAAPFDGVVTRKLSDLGDLAAPGKPLLDLEDPVHLRVETDVGEGLVGNVKLGMVMPVRVSGITAELQGTVTEIAPTADPNSRTFTVKLDLPPAEGLRAGQFARVAVPTAEGAALRVPVPALVERGQLHLVFVVVDGHAVLRLVKPGKRLGDEIEVASGLAPGEVVVVENAGLLLDGQPVRVE